MYVTHWPSLSDAFAFENTDMLSLLFILGTRIQLQHKNIEIHNYFGKSSVWVSSGVQQSAEWTSLYLSVHLEYYYIDLLLIVDVTLSVNRNHKTVGFMLLLHESSDSPITVGRK